MDGGGIKGLVMTQMLFVLEEMLGKPIQECFDWISGTSTGGFLALMVCMGKGKCTLFPEAILHAPIGKLTRNRSGSSYFSLAGT